MKRRLINQSNVARRVFSIAAILIVVVIISAAPASAQDWFKTGTGHKSDRKRTIAVPDLASRSASAPAVLENFPDKVALGQPLATRMLGFSEARALSSSRLPSQLSELKAARSRANAPASATMIAYGNPNHRRQQASPPQDFSPMSITPPRAARAASGVSRQPPPMPHAEAARASIRRRHHRATKRRPSWNRADANRLRQ